MIYDFNFQQNDKAKIVTEEPNIIITITDKKTDEDGDVWYTGLQQHDTEFKYHTVLADELEPLEVS